MKQSIIITTRRKPKTSVRGGSGKGPIDLAKPSKRPTRRRLQKGIRFFDLGVKKSGEAWNAITYVQQHSGISLWSVLQQTPKEQWAATFKEVRDSDQDLYKMRVMLDEYDDESTIRPLSEIAAWSNDSWSISPDQLNRIYAIGDYNESDLPVWFPDKGSMYVLSFGLKDSDRMFQNWKTIITDTPVKPNIHTESVEFSYSSSADWYLLPALPASGGGAITFDPVTSWVFNGVSSLDGHAGHHLIWPRNNNGPRDSNTSGDPGPDTSRFYAALANHSSMPFYHGAVQNSPPSGPWTPSGFPGGSLNGGNTQLALVGWGSYSNENDCPSLVISQNGKWFYFWPIPLDE